MGVGLKGPAAPIRLATQVERGAGLTGAGRNVQGIGGRLPPVLKTVADAELKVARTDLARVLHKRELGLDPATGGKFRANEAQLGYDLEAVTGRRMTRSTNGGDWMDSTGRTYDAVGPVPAQHFKLSSFTDQITVHLRAQGVDRVVIDVRGLAPEQVQGVDTFLGGLSQADTGKLIILR